MNKFDDLIMLIIFDNLPVGELIRNKRVNKRWYYLIEKISIEELIIKHSTDYSGYLNSKSNYWSFNYKPIDEKNIIREEIYHRFDSIIKSRSFINNFKNKIKKLKIHPKYDGFCLSVLREFVKLEYLEVDKTSNPNYYQFEYYNENSIDLELPNLKVLIIRSIDYQIKVTAKLRLLECDSLTNFELKFPKKLKQLNLYSDFYIKRLSEHEDNIEELCNLEIFKCNQIDDDILHQIPSSLKEFHIDYHLSDESFNEIRSILENGSNIKFYYKNILIKCNDKNFEDYGFDKVKKLNNLELIKMNYDYLENKIERLNSINYNDLITIFNQQIPIDFNEKFFNINHIKCIEPVNKHDFLLFLMKCTNLLKLELFYTELDQQFYNKLPELFSRLQILELKEKNDIKLDFSFLTEFKLIELININQNLTIELIDKILINCEFLVYFYFLFQNPMLIEFFKYNFYYTSLVSYAYNREKSFTFNYGGGQIKKNINITNIIDLLTKINEKN